MAWQTAFLIQYIEAKDSGKGLFSVPVAAGVGSNISSMLTFLLSTLEERSLSFSLERS